MNAAVTQQLSADLEPDFTAIEAHLRQNPQRDYMASRGEYLNSIILAKYLGFDFIDAENVVFFKDDGSFDAVLSLNGFHAFLDKEAAYRETFRVLRPGGTFCGCFYVKGEHPRTEQRSPTSIRAPLRTPRRQSLR